jgi:hypothetical protein
MIYQEPKVTEKCFSIGVKAKAYADGAIAVGNGAEAYGRNSLAIGHGVIVHEEGEQKIVVDDWYSFLHEIRIAIVEKENK